MCALCEKPCDVKLTGTVSYGVCLHPHIARIIVPRVKLWGLWLGEEEQPVCLDCKKLNPWTIYPYEATPENKILGRARRCIAANDYIYQRDLV